VTSRICPFTPPEYGHYRGNSPGRRALTRAIRLSHSGTVNLIGDDFIKLYNFGLSEQGGGGNEVEDGVVRNGFWSPYLAGAGLGLTLLATFVVAGWGLGASSAFSLLTGVGLERLSHEYAQSIEYFSRYLNVESPLKNWVLFEVFGVFLGALAGSLIGRSFKIKVDRSEGWNVSERLATGFTGGILIGFASRLARGCTSGLALSGGAQLALAGWLFVMAMFLGGFAAAAVFRRLWS
jgi:hypothetical protein